MFTTSASAKVDSSATQKASVLLPISVLTTATSRMESASAKMVTPRRTSTVSPLKTDVLLTAISMEYCASATPTTHMIPTTTACPVTSVLPTAKNGTESASAFPATEKSAGESAVSVSLVPCTFRDSASTLAESTRDTTLPPTSASADLAMGSNRESATCAVVTTSFSMATALLALCIPLTMLRPTDASVLQDPRLSMVSALKPVLPTKSTMTPSQDADAWMASFSRMVNVLLVLRVPFSM